MTSSPTADASDVGDIDHGLVHGDASGDGGSLPAHQYFPAIGEQAIVTVSVADRQQRDAGWARRTEGCVVADGFSGGDGAKRGDAGLPT